MDRKKLDECLVRTQKGDKGAFSRFYAETARGVFAFLYGYYRAYHRTEDATQDVYLKALKNVASYRPGTDARAWLLQIAKNTALNDLKRERREACPRRNSSGFCAASGRKPALSRRWSGR